MLPLEGLFLLLEKEGFRLTLDIRLRVKRVLQARGSGFFEHPEELKLILGPVIAKNQLEQEKFRWVFNNYYQQLILQSEPESYNGKTLLLDEEEKKQGFKRYWPFAAVLLIAIFSSYFFFFASNIDKPATYFDVLETFRVDSVKTPTDTFIFINRTPNEKSDLRFTWTFIPIDKSKKGDNSYIDQKIAQAPSIPSQKDSIRFTLSASDTYLVSLKATNNQGVDSTYIRILSKVPTTPHEADLKIPLPQKEISRSEQPDFEFKFSDRIKLLLLLVLLLFWGLWELLLHLRRRGVFLSQRIKDQFKTGGSPPYYLPFLDKNEHIIVEAELYTVANSMRQRRQGEIKKLNAHKSIRSTLRHGGFPEIVFEEKSTPSEYLILIDQTTRRNHPSQLFTFLTDFLLGEDVYLDTFYFDTDPRICWNNLHPNGLSIDQLQERYRGYRLIIIGDCNFLVEDVFDLKLKNWVNHSFGYWADRAIISDKPVNNWDYQEEILNKFFALIPASLKGQLNLIDHMLYPEAIDIHTTIDEVVKEEDALEPYEDENLEYLKKYFNKKEFSWLCTLALHPELIWEITLALGLAVEAYYANINYDGDDRGLLTYSVLLKLSRLSWIEQSELPNKLRKDLLVEITRDKKLEGIARNTIKKTLEEIEIDQNVFSSRERNIGIVIQSALANKGASRDWQALKFLWNNKMLDQLQYHLLEKYFKAKPLHIIARGCLLLLLFLISYCSPHVKEYEQDIIENIGFQKVLKDNDLLTLSNFDSAIYYNNLGADYYDMFKYDTARTNFRKSIVIAETRNFDYPTPSQNLDIVTYKEGVNSYRNNRFQTSIDTFRQLILKDSLLLDVLNNIGVNHVYLTQEDSAQYYIDRINSIDPEYFKRVKPNVYTLLSKIVDARSENIQGYWQGELFQGGGSGIAPKYPVDLVIKQDGDRISGTFKISLQGTDDYGIIYFTGKYINNTAIIQEQYVVEKKITRGWWLIKNYNLQFREVSKGRQILEGRWEAIDSGIDFNSPDNQIIVRKISDLPQRN